MNLLPGCRIALAPRFHLEPDWSERLRIGGGAEESLGRFFPRGPWGAPSAHDLAALVGTAPDDPPLSLPLLGAVPARAGAGADSDPDTIALFRLPGHLRAAWWELLDETTGSGGPVRGFDEFAARVIELFTFKGLDAPTNTRMEAVVTAAGQRSIRRDPATGRPAGLAPTVAPWTPWPTTEPIAVPRLWGAVNLGDEDSGVVLVNLTLSHLAAELARRVPGAAPPETVAELVRRFLRAVPDYPLVRVRLGPGEGCRVPPGGLILDGDPADKAEPDVLLLISQDAPATPAPTTP